MSREIANPFPVNAYQGKQFFCDRETETERILLDIRNGISTTIFAIRRVGKTGLIHHVLGQLPKNYKGVYIDILETEDLNSFLELLATSLLTSFPERSKTGKRFWEFIKSLRPVFSYDALTGAPQATFEIKQKETETNIQAILKFLDQQEDRIVIAIDEFQQITQYPEKNTDAWLRTRMQELKNISFIFSGSQQHLMTELFSSPQRPFFRSTQLMKLEKLEKERYRDFIVSQFRKNKKEMPVDLAEDILEWANIHTYYVQLLCNRIFSGTKDTVTEELWKAQAAQLLKDQEPVFFMQRNVLTRPQWLLLKAIAQEGKVLQPTSARFLSKYGLGSSATVLRSLNSLLKYELVYQEFNQEGGSSYSVYDVFMQRWAQSSK